MRLAGSRDEVLETCNGHLAPPFSGVQSPPHHQWCGRLADVEQVHPYDFAILTLAELDELTLVNRGEEESVKN